MTIRAWLRWDRVAALTKLANPNTILEVGCGQGGMGARLCEARSYAAVEPDRQSYLMALHWIEPRGGQVLHGTTEVLPSGAQYDMVCAFDVLEHLEDDHAALREWTDRVRPGGHLLLSVPAFESWFGASDKLVGHYRRYEPADIRQMVEEAGLTTRALVMYGWPLIYLTDSVRNRVARSQLRGSLGKTKAERTAVSGRTLQPTSRVIGLLTRLGTLPFRYLQRARPQSGNALVILAERPPARRERTG
jgi:2-polyprenyl-3-methyl-5-hydroxy-6-metoxy-1,4-benzoquinol methylase